MKRPGHPAPPRGVVTPPEMHPADLARPGAALADPDVCPHCRGTGLVGGDACPTCDGIGRMIDGTGIA